MVVLLNYAIHSIETFLNSAYHLIYFTASAYLVAKNTLVQLIQF